MSDFDRNVAAARGGYATDRALAIDAGLRAHMIRVYNYMAGAVALTGVVAWLTFQMATATTATGQLALTPLGQTLFNSPLKWVVILAPLALVFFISFRIDRLQVGTAMTLFLAFATLLGISLATIFIAYTGTSITRVFFISAASFGALSLYGYTTQRNLSAIGNDVGIAAVEQRALAPAHLGFVRRLKLERSGPVPHRMRVDAGDGGDVGGGSGADGDLHGHEKAPRNDRGALVSSLLRNP